MYTTKKQMYVLIHINSAMRISRVLFNNIHNIYLSFCSPLGQMIRPFIDAMSVQQTGGHALFSDTPPQPSASQSGNKAPPSTSKSSQSQNSAQSKQTERKDEDQKFKPFVFETVRSFRLS